MIPERMNFLLHGIHSAFVCRSDGYCTHVDVKYRATRNFYSQWRRSISHVDQRQCNQEIPIIVGVPSSMFIDVINMRTGDTPVRLALYVVSFWAVDPLL